MREAAIGNKAIIEVPDDYFKEFDITDTYKKGEYCWACAKNLRCKKHGVQRLGLAKDKDDFFGK